MHRSHNFLARVLISSLFLLLVLLLAGCDQTTQTQKQTTSSSSTAIYMRLEQNRLLPNFSYLCNGPGQFAPPLVAIVTVDSYLPGHWNTPDGTRPANLTSQNVASSAYTIVTPLHFSQMSTLWDKRAASTSEFVTQGGQDGQDKIIVEDDNQLLLGQSYLVFFYYSHLPYQNGSTQKQLYVAVSFPMKTPQIVIIQQKAIEQGQITQVEKTMPLAQIQQMLTRCVGKSVKP